MSNKRSLLPGAAAHIISLTGPISQDLVDLAPGAALPAGTLLAFDAANKRYLPYDNAVEAAGKAVAVLYAPTPERTEVTRVTVTSRLAELQAGLLHGLDDPARADLAAAFIVLR
jgi:hypothetical protein